MEKTTKGEGIACSNYANCYVGCSCNTSNGWYSSCSSTGGTDCKSVTDTRYTGVNAMSVSNVGDVTSLTDGVSTQSAGGNTQVVSLSGGVSTMSSSGATTCYKKKTCEEGGYYSSVPTDQKCSSKSYNGYTCYYNCSYKTCSDYGYKSTCSDYGYKSSIPSGQTCTKVTPRSGLTCYKDCKDDTPATPYRVTFNGFGSGITGEGSLGASCQKGGPLQSVTVSACFDCNSGMLGCFSGKVQCGFAPKLDNLGTYSGCVNSMPEYMPNTCSITISASETPSITGNDTVVGEGGTFTVKGKKYILECN